ncbi:hypothetical protein Drose_26365 [Dactylosporangium roseum]|uniref:Uncharacterized protein n=1 Tax=Dactylosporangium roseum TaxID=47989 RepID=A0ABY5YY97_9ACTN|nr:hypothetical protein [Dactylosporangium roseum]UWZ34719.1 hypothetical protein Drose_26365 [Dactylosporangium roseum]
MRAGYLRDWDRTLRAANHPDTTRYNYLLAGVQLAGYIAERHPGDDGVADDPTRVSGRRCRVCTPALHPWV